MTVVTEQGSSYMLQQPEVHRVHGCPKHTSTLCAFTLTANRGRQKFCTAGSNSSTHFRGLHCTSESSTRVNAQNILKGVTLHDTQLYLTLPLFLYWSSKSIVFGKVGLHTCEWREERWSAAHSLHYRCIILKGVVSSPQCPNLPPTPP